MAELRKNRPNWQTVKALFNERKYVLAQAIVDQLIANSGLPSESENLFVSAESIVRMGNMTKP